MIFSCRRFSRLTFDRLERRLGPFERLGRFAHLTICRHCCSHVRQVEALARLFELKRQLAETQPGSSESPLSEEARNRIRAALARRLPGR